MVIGGMSKSAKTEQSAESCYETPQWLVERIREAFGGVIDLDPCTTPENPVGATRFIAPPNDGILPVWGAPGRKIYINQPYGRTIHHWTDKAVNAASPSYSGASIILLVPARTDSAWFHRLVTAHETRAVLFLKGRLTFKSLDYSAPFPSALVGLNHDLADLADLGWRVKTA